ncbi:MAG: alpha/beta fold hydrolase [Telluria sp.]
MNHKKLCASLFVACLPFIAAGAHAAPAPESTTVLLSPEIGGIKQFVEVKTDDPEKPVLLFLSGGPGSSMMNNADRFTSALKSKFTIVQWDQRDAGKTLKLNPSPTPPTLAQMENDTYQVVEYLRKTYRKDKIYVLGSSWGTVLGFYLVKKHPELLHAYFAVNPVVSQSASEKELLASLKQHYKDDAQASKELATVKIPFTVDEDLFYLRKWLFFKEGKTFATSADFKENFLKWSSRWSPVYNQVLEIDLPTSLQRVDVPTYFFVGGHDIQTSTRITEDYFMKLKAPKKKIFMFEKSGHQIHHDEPEKLQDAIIQTLATGGA